MKFKYLTFDPSKGSGGWGKLFIAVMLIYRHWVIMAYRKKLSGIIALGKSEVY